MASPSSNIELWFTARLRGYDISLPVAENNRDDLHIYLFYYFINYQKRLCMISFKIVLFIKQIFTHGLIFEENVVNGIPYVFLTKIFFIYICT